MDAIFSFGGWVRRRRRALDLTQAELAARAGVTAATIRKIEADERRPSPQSAARLAAALEIPAAELALFRSAARAALSVDRLPHPAAEELLAVRAVGGPAPAPGSLPAPPNALLGRDAEVAELARWLTAPAMRLVTVTGPGGVGKTRLALAAAARAAPEFPDGVWFVDLAPLGDPRLVASAIARALGLPARTPPVAQLQRYLAARRLLLLLDNMEQVADAGLMLAELLAAAPGCAALVTSRVALNLAAELRFPVPPLDVPADGRPDIVSSPAVRLFETRACAVRPDFALGASDAATVAVICRRLDGLPLAIELAASWARLLGPAELLARLDRRLELPGAARDLPARQRTMRDTIAWSYALLTPDEQALFDRLGVFVGGCDLAAAQAVLGAEEIAALSAVAALVDHSLLRRVDAAEASPGPRLAMLETIREFALNRLAETGALEETRLRHAHHYVQLVAAADRELRGGPHYQRWVDALEADHENLRAALGWCLGGGAPALGVRLAGLLGYWWLVRGYDGEAQEWLVRAAAQDAACGAAPADEALVLYWLGKHAVMRDELAFAVEQFERGLELYRALGDADGAALLTLQIGRALREGGDYARAEDLARATLDHARGTDDIELLSNALDSLADALLDQGRLRPVASLIAESRICFLVASDTVGLSENLINHGRLASVGGRHADALAEIEEGLAIARAHGIRLLEELGLVELGRAARAAGDSGRAARCFGEALTLLLELRAMGRDVSYCLEGLGGIAAERGCYDVAARLLGAADTLRQRIVTPRPPVAQAELARDLALARSGLAPRAFAAAWSAGAALSLDEAAALALRVASGDAPVSPAPAAAPG